MTLHKILLNSIGNALELPHSCAKPSIINANIGSACPQYDRLHVYDRAIDYTKYE